MEVKVRMEKLRKVQELLRERRILMAEMMTAEMGKPLAQSEGEIDKCISHIDYSIEKSLEFMRDEIIPTRQLKSFITCEPVGPFLDIVPWNYPYWMPFKSMIPPLVLGNPILLKGSPSTVSCS